MPAKAKPPSATSLPPFSEEDLATIERLKAMPDSEIDFSDQPQLTQEQLDGMRPARDFEEFRRWQDINCPEQVEAFEEARRRWHARHNGQQK